MTKTKKFNKWDYLKTPKAMRAYINEQDREIGRLLRALKRIAKGSKATPEHNGYYELMEIAQRALNH